PELDPEPEAQARVAPRRSWLQQNRSLALSLGCVALCFVIAADVYWMLRTDARRSAPAAPNAVASTSREAPEPPSPAAALPPPSASSAPGDEPSDATDVLDYESDDGEPREAKPSTPKHFSTVQQAAVESCTTASVDGLSRQIIAQARCIKPNAFVPLPTRPNLVIASQVFPYLELEARDRLLKALDAKPKVKMTINSALRTVAQQYLVWRWSATKRCGVPLATPPGESNHEIGTALDIAEAGTWRPALEAQQFKWLGKSDRVHFDYKGGSSAPGGSATDVLAFQKLWNRNHPTDKINEDGRYSPAVEQRLRQAPPDGFELGPSCAKPAPKR
ncbi:MAG TPA: M15 family metallopeptidase, partial [Polyangiaceae bacterium]|nr:M15 family metallopeptidase [Polyangiaceae bacterium]